MGTPVHVWLIRLDGPTGPPEDLDEHERRAAASLSHPPDRARYLARHGSVRAIVAHHVQVPGADLRFAHGVHGKPYLSGPGKGLHVNASHSEDLGAVAVTRAGPVGVDVERVRDDIDAVRLARRYFLPPEARYVADAPRHQQAARFARLWTRKEACLKAAGGRLTQGLRLPVLGAGDIVVHDPGGALPGPYHLRDVPAPDGFLAAVAVLAVVGSALDEMTVGWWA